MVVQGKCDRHHYSPPYEENLFCYYNLSLPIHRYAFIDMRTPELAGQWAKKRSVELTEGKRVRLLRVTRDPNYKALVKALGKNLNLAPSHPSIKTYKLILTRNPNYKALVKALGKSQDFQLLPPHLQLKNP